ncbi:flagellar protein FlaG [Neobacillus muris]|uniref:flagellar protein FlaG n=1 Tax=Neobacillus muris TaxID=2941334 RepID=UPI00203DA5C0|nr:flagellar protein FlaG [Neobacillus muris]
MSIHSTTFNLQNNQSYSTKYSGETGSPSSPEQTKPADERPQTANGTGTTEERVQHAIKNFNQIFNSTHIEFQMHEDSGKYFVQIIDNQSKEVLKQIPSEEFLEMAAATKEQQQSLLLDTRV